MAHKNKTNYSPYKARRASVMESDQSNKKTNGESHEKSKEKSYSQSPSKKLLRGKHRQAQRVFSLEEANDRLFDLFRNHEFGDYPHSKRRQFAHFYTLLMEIQKKENFTRLTEIKEIGIKHFIDCLMVGQLTSLKFPLMDVGTGPGFPGIPLKIEHPDETIILAEGVQRRVEFLKDVREKMEFKNLPILGRNINQECFYPVQGVITRAVEDLRNTLGNVIHCLQLGGRVYFMKGPGVDPEIPMALEKWSEFYQLIEDHHYVLPKTEQERRLIVFEKIKSPEVSDEFLESLGLLDEDER